MYDLPTVMIYIVQSHFKECELSAILTDKKLPKVSHIILMTFGSFLPVGKTPLKDSKVTLEKGTNGFFSIALFF